jgi:hypothetical protein
MMTRDHSDVRSTVSTSAADRTQTWLTGHAFGKMLDVHGRDDLSRIDASLPAAIEADEMPLYVYPTRGPRLIGWEGRSWLLVTDRAVYSSYLAESGRLRLPLADIRTVEFSGDRTEPPPQALPTPMAKHRDEEVLALNGRTFFRSRCKPISQLAPLIRDLRDIACQQQSPQPLPDDELVLMAAQLAAAGKDGQQITDALAEAGDRARARQLAADIETIRARPRNVSGVILLVIGLLLLGPLFLLATVIAEFVGDFTAARLLSLASILVGAYVGLVLVAEGVRILTSGKVPLRCEVFSRELPRLQSRRQP